MIRDGSGKRKGRRNRRRDRNDAKRWYRFVQLRIAEELEAAIQDAMP